MKTWVHMRFTGSGILARHNTRTLGAISCISLYSYRPRKYMLVNRGVLDINLAEGIFTTSIFEGGDCCGDFLVWNCCPMHEPRGTQDII
jgi:hypothetical protein